MSCSISSSRRIIFRGNETMANAGRSDRNERVAAATVSLIVASAIVFSEAFVLGEWHAAIAAKQSCQDKRKACEGRCRQHYPSDWKQITACYTRTCDKQYDNCTADSSGGGTTGTRVDVDQPRGRPITPKVIFPGARPGGGILDTPQGEPRPRVPTGTGVLAPN